MPSFQCKSCGQRSNVSNVTAGDRLRCPHCGATWRAGPRRVQAHSHAEPPPAPSRFTGTHGGELSDDEIAAMLGERVIGPSTPLPIEPPPIDAALFAQPAPAQPASKPPQLRPALFELQLIERPFSGQPKEYNLRADADHLRLVPRDAGNILKLTLAQAASQIKLRGLWRVNVRASTGELQRLGVRPGKDALLQLAQLRSWLRRGHVATDPDARREVVLELVRAALKPAFILTLALLILHLLATPLLVSSGPWWLASGSGLVVLLLAIAALAMALGKPWGALIVTILTGAEALFTCVALGLYTFAKLAGWNRDPAGVVALVLLVLAIHAVAHFGWAGLSCTAFVWSRRAARLDWDESARVAGSLRATQGNHP